LVKQRIVEAGGIGEICKADVGDYEQAKQLIDFCINKYGRLDVLVNNAGISQIKLFEEINLSEWNEMIRVNLGSVYNCTHNAIPYMMKEKSGKVINVSSIWGMTGASCEVHYSTAKAGIIGFTKALAKELGPSNIQVNCVAPGVVSTDMLKGLTQEEQQELVINTPLRRIGTTDDIANVISFLASDKSEFITGQVISPNGGFAI
jgi:3-oxoacyl-[acyl-carrier protein] reductase